MISKLLDAVFDQYPDEPDWAHVKELAYTCEQPVETITELARVLWLYNEDHSAFSDFMLTLEIQ